MSDYYSTALDTAAVWGADLNVQILRREPGRMVSAAITARPRARNFGALPGAKCGDVDIGRLRRRMDGRLPSAACSRRNSRLKPGQSSFHIRLLEIFDPRDLTALPCSFKRLAHEVRLIRLPLGFEGLVQSEKRSRIAGIL
jgi:hypothetical protein